MTTHRQTIKPKLKSRRSQSSSPYLVFISHSSLDLWIAKVIAEKISALGAEVWLDEKDLEGGDNILLEITYGIDACNEALVLLSPNCMNSHWAIFEIGAAHGQHKRVTPILNNVAPDAIAPIKGLKAIDLNRLDQFLIQLKERIQGCLKSKRS